MTTAVAASACWTCRCQRQSQLPSPTDSDHSLQVNPVTAVGFFRVLDVPKGEWLLSNAASSTLGRMVIQLGKKWVSANL